jgi:hypothetical protein
MLQIHLIEHASMSAQGLSAETPMTKQHLAGTATFASEAEFWMARDDVASRIAAAPKATHLVVICTHGWEATGTWLDMGGSKGVAILNVLFPSPPGKLLIYLAVCWGGYAGTITRLQQGKATPYPTVVGALAPLTAEEGNEMQDELIKLALSGMPSDGDVEATVKAFNAKYLSEYGHPAMRAALSNGTLVPEQSNAGIAWQLLRDTADNVIDGPFMVAAINNNRTAEVTAVGQTWTVPTGYLDLAKKAPIVVGDQFTFKAKLDPTGNVLRIVPPAKVFP